MPAPTPTRRQLLVLGFVFLLSGCAALIYEVLWFQMLELVIGSSAISLGILLGVFMGGMCVGSLLAPSALAHPRIARLHPLHAYALIELAIAALGLLMLALIPFAGSIYISWSASGVGGLILRGAVAGACLLPPAMLMGATLPAIARWVEHSPRGASWLGLFYGGNIFGAVAGTLLAAFVLLRIFDITIATLAAATLNVLAALLALRVAKSECLTVFPAAAPGADDAAAPPDMARLYLTIGLSGLTALACEVIWTRQLSLFAGATVYAFALILAAFLLGLGIGASIGAALARRTTHPRATLGLCQLLLSLGIGWAAYQLEVHLPFWQASPEQLASPWFKLQFDLLRCLWAVLPATILWGISFPLAVAAAVDSGLSPARSTARIYGANTLGAIVGALATSLWLLTAFGSSRAQVLLGWLCAAAAIIGPGLRRWPQSLPPAVKLVLVISLPLAVSWLVPPISPDVLAYGRLVNQAGRAQVLYAGEGISSTVAVSRRLTGELNYHGAGKIQASTEYQDMRLQRILGHLTTLLARNPKRVLVIGFGAGITAGAASIEPQLESETIVEIEPLVPEKIAPFFKDANFDLIHNPRARVVIDDGRHYLLTTHETYDGITSDPLDPWVKGTAALYTREFFELARRRLSPGGVMTQFVQLYESNEEAVRSEIATFFEVFPEGLVFANTIMSQGYDLVLLGQNSPQPIDLDELEARLDRPEYAGVSKSMEEVGFYSPTDMLGTYVARAADLRQWLHGAAINRDRNLRLQYLAGMGLNEHSETEIYRHITETGPQFSRELFKGSDALMEYLQRAVETGSSR